MSSFGRHLLILFGVWATLGAPHVSHWMDDASPPPLFITSELAEDADADEVDDEPLGGREVARRPLPALAAVVAPEKVGGPRRRPAVFQQRGPPSSL